MVKALCPKLWRKITKNHNPFNCKFWSIYLYIHKLADTYWDSCATWWKLGYLEKLRFHFWWVAIHMKMSIKVSPSKVLIKKFMGRSFLIRYLLPCIFLLLHEFFFSIWFRFSHWLNRHFTNFIVSYLAYQYFYILNMSRLWETLQIL